MKAKLENNTTNTSNIKSNIPNARSKATNTCKNPIKATEVKAKAPTQATSKAINYYEKQINQCEKQNDQRDQCEKQNYQRDQCEKGNHQYKRRQKQCNQEIQFEHQKHQSNNEKIPNEIAKAPIE